MAGFMKDKSAIAARMMGAARPPAPPMRATAKPVRLQLKKGGKVKKK